MASSIVALGEEDVVVDSAFERLVERDGLAHELLLDVSKTIETGLKLKVVVAISLGNCRYDGNVVALGADVVGRRDDGDVNVWSLR